MKYQLFSDLDSNFGVHFMDELSGEIIKEVDSDPITGKKFTRDEAIEYAESIVNPKDPKTKQEFFSMFSDEDYENYLESIRIVNARYSSEHYDPNTKEFKIILTKFDLRPDFEFSDQDIIVLRKFCKEFNISLFKTL